jgi:hypothetical protein
VAQDLLGEVGEQIAQDHLVLCHPWSMLRICFGWFLLLPCLYGQELL